MVRLLDAGVDVVSCNDDPEAVAQLLSLHAEACHRGVQLIAGAGFSPGLSELLAVHAAASLESVARVSIAVAGTGGPACARQHHRSLKRDGIEFWEGAWHTRRGGSGRDLVWFPEPIGARDCYHAALASPRLVRRAVSNAKSVAARRSATRRDRSTSRFPMLRPPHADGGPGAIRVEVRGRSGDEVLTVVYGVSCNPAEGAALVATEFCRPSTRSPGAFGAAECGPVRPRLEALRQRGMKIMTYEADVPRD